MSTSRVVYVASACAMAIVVGSVLPTAQVRVNHHAAVLADFEKRLQDYVALQRHASSGLPPLKQTPNPEEIMVAERALGDSVRAGRATARQGDIFTTDVAPVFQKEIREHYARQTRHGRKEMLDEAPDFRPAINGVYPPTLPKATFPPKLLHELPRLPNDLEYRIVGTYLVLRDVKANIIVDFIPNVLPKSAKAHEGRP